MKGNRFFKNIRHNITIIFLTSFLFLNNAFSAGTILYVSDGATDPPNWDIYQMNADGTGVTRLTDSPSIDNHPVLSPDGTTVVFSSDATGNFEIYKAPLASLDDEITWEQLTTFGCGGSTSPNRCTPARHPHWSPDGTEIIYTAKDGCCPTTDTFIDECSVPFKIVDPCGEHYERIHIMNSSGGNPRVIDPLVLGGGGCDAPTIWHCGHPSFNPDGDKIIFTGATNRDGTVWDVFVTGWDGTTASGLTKITEGTDYPPSQNPISMSGGGAFANEGRDILFSSTRLPKGNSQLFRINDWTEQTLPIAPGDDIRLTFHCGNDYVPHEHKVGGGYMIVYVSDASAPGQPWSNPTDLDIWTMNADGSMRTNLTNTPTRLEVLLLADEVSWFCGLPRNLSPCHFIPRIYTVESFYLMLYADDMLPPTFPNRDLYSVYIHALYHWKEEHVPKYLVSISQMLSDYMNSNCYTDLGPCPEALPRLTLPTFMPVTDDSCPEPNDVDCAFDTWCSDCVECDDCLIIAPPPPLSAAADLQDGNVGDPYSQTFTVDGGNAPISWQIFAGQLPPGLSLNQSTGEISGTPTQSGTFAFSIASSDTNGNADSVDDKISIIGTSIEDPIPDIKANNSDGPVTVTQGANLTVTVSLGPGSHTGENADWWVYATSPFGTYWFTLDLGWQASGTPIRVYGGPLFSLSPYTVLDMSTLPVGDYDFNISVDDNMDNIKDDTYLDSAEVTIQ